MGASRSGRAAVERRLALQDPAPQVLHPADFGEARRVGFERQRAAAIQQLVLRREQRLEVVFGERAVVEDGLAREPFDVVQRQAGEIVDQLLDHLHVDARHAAVLLRPFARHAHDDGVALVLVRHAQREARRQVLELLRQLHLVADEHERARAFLVFLRDVLERAHEQRVFEIRVEIEQHVDAGHGGGLDVPQQLLGLRQGALRAAQVDVDAQQSFGHRPLEHAPVPAALGLQGRFAHQLDDAAFFAAFDDHQRHAGGQQGLQFSGGGDVGEPTEFMSGAL